MNSNNADLYSWGDSRWRGEAEGVWFCGTA